MASHVTVMWERSPLSSVEKDPQTGKGSFKSVTEPSLEPQCAQPHRSRKEIPPISRRQGSDQLCYLVIEVKRLSRECSQSPLDLNPKFNKVLFFSWCWDSRRLFLMEESAGRNYTRRASSQAMEVLWVACLTPAKETALKAVWRMQPVEIIASRWFLINTCLICFQEARRVNLRLTLSVTVTEALEFYHLGRNSALVFFLAPGPLHRA